MSPSGEHVPTMRPDGAITERCATALLGLALLPCVHDSLTKPRPSLCNVCTIEFASPPGASVQALVGDHTRPGPPLGYLDRENMAFAFTTATLSHQRAARTKQRSLPSKAGAAVSAAVSWPGHRADSRPERDRSPTNPVVDRSWRCPTARPNSAREPSTVCSTGCATLVSSRQAVRRSSTGGCAATTG
jgi:hypothetical protein